MNKNFVINLSLFVFILVTMLVSMSLFLHVGARLSTDAVSYKTNLVVDHELDVPITFWGSSIAEGAFDPTIFEKNLGKSCYNMGYSGRRIMDWRGILNEYLDYTEKSEVIVLSVFPNTLNMNKAIYNTHFFYAYLYKENIYNSLLDLDKNIWKYRYIPVYNLTNMNGEYVNTALSGWESYWNDKKCTSVNGYNKVKGSFSENRKFVDINISNEVVLEYKKVIAAANKKNIKVVFVASPVYYKGYKRYTNPESVYKVFENFADGKNVFFINYSTLPSIVTNINYFTNNTHLNDVGAERFSELVSLEMKKLLGEIVVLEGGLIDND